MKKNTKEIASLFGTSLICFLIICWGAALSLADIVWMETMAFYLLSIHETIRRKDELNTITIASAIILGRIILEIPIRISDFSSSVGSLSVTIACVSSIILGCYVAARDVRTQYAVISLIILYTIKYWAIHIYPNLPYIGLD